MQRGGGVQKAVGQISRSGVAAKAVGQSQRCAVVQVPGGMNTWEEGMREQADLWRDTFANAHVCTHRFYLPFFLFHILLVCFTSSFSFSFFL